LTPGKRNTLAGAVLCLCAHHAAAASPGLPLQPSLAAPAPLTFAVGDTLKVSFYEPSNDDAKWAALGRLREPGPSFYLHDEISGDYTVASDWTISIPMIGNVVVAHHTAADIDLILGKVFSKAVGHPGFVNVSISKREPLYVIGDVNRPGVYEFAPGMTPLNLVALAGGYRTTSLPDQGSAIGAVEETAKQIANVDQLSHALAQYTVLQAEIRNTTAMPTEQLVDLLGESGADVLVREEEAKRTGLVQVREAQLKALQIAVDAAQNTYNIDQGRLQPTKDAIGVHLARLASLSTLSREGLIAQLQLDQGQDTVSDYQDRQQNVLSTIAEDQRQLALAKVDVSKFIADTDVDLTQQLDERQREIDDLTPSVAAGNEVIKLLAGQGASDDHVARRFSVVRGGQVVAADVTTGLQPGDVLQIDRDASQPTAQIGTASGMALAAPLLPSSGP
jgi:protein involved in polysaccharide export with SLBB domain